MTQAARNAATLCLCLLLAGCMVGPDYKAPLLETPAAFSNSALSHGVMSPDGKWWSGFGDPQLNALINTALSQNLDVQAALLRLKQARAITGPVNSALFPTLDSSASAKQSREGTTGIQTSSANYSLDASWELDLWGGKKRNFEAATDRLEGNVSDVNAARLSLIAELATSYIDLKTAMARQRLTTAQIKLRQETLGLTRSKLQAGLVSDSDVLRAEAILASTQAQLPDLESAIVRNTNRLAVLLGQMPGSKKQSVDSMTGIPKFSKSPATGVPADLARRRPDIVKLERELAASTADVGVAEADLYPKLSLIGSIGGSETNSNGLTVSAPGTWSFGPSISLPIFDAGKRRAQVASKQARVEEALVNWKQAVIKGVEDVENAIANYRLEQKKRKALQRSLASSKKSLVVSQELYEKGLTSFLDVLDTERTASEAENALIESDAQLARNVIALYKALGGGW
jgi:outer membrane protein, multidrug efflux system